MALGILSRRSLAVEQLASCRAWSTDRGKGRESRPEASHPGRQSPGPGGIRLLSGPDRRREVREGQFVGINSTALLIVSPSTASVDSGCVLVLGSRRYAPIRRRARQYPPPGEEPRGDVHGPAKACHWQPRPAKTVSTTSSALDALQLPVNHPPLCTAPANGVTPWRPGHLGEGPT